jgi:hypothetical protein
MMKKGCVSLLEKLKIYHDAVCHEMNTKRTGTSVANANRWFGRHEPESL